jgi:hypothetical protein
VQFILQYLYHLKNLYSIIKCYTAEDSALCSALHDNMPTHCMLLVTVNWHSTIWPATDTHMFLNKLYPLVYKVQLVLPIISTFPSFHIPRSEHHKTETQTVCILKIKTSLAHFTFHYYKFLLTVLQCCILFAYTAYKKCFYFSITQTFTFPLQTCSLTSCFSLN